jgi:hypothetical protein
MDRRDEAQLARVGRASDTDPKAGSCPRVVCEEEKMKKMPLLARAVVYLLAFLVPPVLVAFVETKAALSDRYKAPPDYFLPRSDLDSAPGLDRLLVPGVWRGRRT